MFSGNVPIEELDERLGVSIAREGFRRLAASPGHARSRARGRRAVRRGRPSRRGAGSRAPPREQGAGAETRGRAGGERDARGAGVNIRLQAAGSRLRAVGSRRPAGADDRARRPSPQAGAGTRPLMKSGFVSLVGRPTPASPRCSTGSSAPSSPSSRTSRRRRATGSSACGTPPSGQVVFLDTPGIHRPLHRMNVRMLDAALDSMRDVDVVVLVLDVTQRPGGGRPVHGGLIRKLDRAGRPDAEQDRSGRRGEAAADHRRVEP